MSVSPRIPEGQAEAGSLAAGRLRSLEDQLTRAKQKIHSFQKLTGDGKHVCAIWKLAGRDLAQSLEILNEVFITHAVGLYMVKKKTKKTKSRALVSFRLKQETQLSPALNLMSDGECYVCAYHTK